MKKKLSIIFLSLVILVSSFSSYAMDASPNGLSSYQLLAYSKNYDGVKVKKESKRAYEIKHDKVVSERLVLYDAKRRNDFVGKTDAYGSSFAANASRPGIIDPLVGNVSHYLAQNAVTTNPNPKPLDLSLPSSLSEVAQVGAAFLTNLVIHEVGHAVVAAYSDARGSKLKFFGKDGDTFFLGESFVNDIDPRSILPYTAGGEFFADVTFEHALKNYRKSPTMYNKSLLLFSGTDFLWYCAYAFYLTEGHSSYDPVTISKETGMSGDKLIAAAIAKTAMNAYRIYSGTDKVIPYFTVDKYSASFNVVVPVKNLWIEELPLLSKL